MTGRPLIVIDPKVVEGMALVGATDGEIADFCRCSVDTITRRFADILLKGRTEGKTRLRQAQFKAAIGGNVVMMIWLGKQILGQQDKYEHTGPDGGPIQVSNVAAGEEFMGRVEKLIARLDAGETAEQVALSIRATATVVEEKVSTNGAERP